MDVTILQSNLQKSLNAISRVISQKVQLPILSNVLITAKKGEVVLSATNLNESISITLPTKVDREGSITIPGKLFAEFVHLLGNKPVHIVQKQDRVMVTCENAQAEFAGILASEFPKVPVFEEPATFSLPIAFTETIVSRVCFAASKDDSRPHLTGVYLKLADGAIEVVATDGFRLSRISTTFKPNVVPEPLLMPAKTIEELAKLAKDFAMTQKDTIATRVLDSQNQVLFRFGAITFSSRLIEGKFPDYEKVIPRESTTELTIEREALLQAVKLASVFSRDSMAVIKLAVGIDGIMVSSDAKEIGNDEITVSADIEGDPQEVAFNPRFLLEFLQNSTIDELTIQFSGPLNPVVFSKPGDNTFIHVIMPVRT